MVEGRQLAKGESLPVNNSKTKINGIDFEIKTEILRGGCGVEKLINRKSTEADLVV